MSQKIVIVGAGFSGLWSALAAVRLIDLNGGDAAGIEVTVVAPEQNLVLRPRLYEENPAKMSVPLIDLFRATGIQFVKGIVDTIRTTGQEIEVVDPAGGRSTLSYDRLILAAGSRLVRPNISGLHDHAFSIDQIKEAAELETHLRGLSTKPSSKARNTVVICGGGFTGVEIAAELPSRLRSILGAESNMRVIIVEQANDIGPVLGPGPRPIIIQALNELGVEMKLGAGIASIDADGVVTVEGERIEANTVVWTAGLAASELAKQIHGEKDAHGRLYVDQDLRVPSSKNIFVTGDVASAATEIGGKHRTMMSCQHAVRLGRVSGHNAAADLLEIGTVPYTQPYYGTCVDLGTWGAVLTEGWDRKVKLSHSEAKAMKQFVNRVAVYPPPANKAEALAAADPADLGPVPT